MTVPDFTRRYALAARVGGELARQRVRRIPFSVLWPDIHPKTIRREHDWWFSERVGPDHGNRESSANVLVSESPPYDPAMDTYPLRGLLCSSERE